MTDNVAIVKDFIAAWGRLDVDEIVSYFAPDGTYHNMPFDPVSGHENLKTFIAGFTANWSETNWETLNIAEVGDVVIAERLDHAIVDGKPLALPCCGVFEMEAGKIKVWRDYFDMQTYMNQVG